ncbi:acetolactate synthase large subunit [Candidatus Uhrbacteria bacterium]|nr:acetolactate synthase large subunit [Candidatus Uhrbacteria bacterium]
MKASDLFVRALEQEGIKYIFGVPGEENLDFLESLRPSTIQFVLTRHEQAAGFMAATIGRLTGKAGVCLSTLGPGATNLLTSAAYAQLGGMPMVMITGQKALKHRRQGHFQMVDTIEMFDPVTKLNKQIIDGNDIPALVRDAFRVAEEERPGAVHLELPEDVAHEEVEGAPLLVTNPRRPIAEEKAVRIAVAMIEAAKHPLILIGAGANRKRTSKMLSAFVEKTGIPFFSTQMGKGVLDERHPRALGTAALSANDYLHCAVEHADLIINVGHDVVEKPPFIMTQGQQKVIHINFSSAHVDAIYFPHHEVIGDIANALWHMGERIQKQPHWDFSYDERVREELRVHMEERAHDDHVPMLPQRIINDLRAVVPEDGIVTLDNGMYKLWFARNYPCFLPNTLLLDNALATMGAGLPAAIAATLVAPEKKVVAVCGDGGFMMSAAELETAVRLKLDLTVIILNDRGLGMIAWKQQAEGLAPFGLTFGNPDFVALAQSFGATGHRVREARDLHAMLTACLQEQGVHVIEVPIDYSENDRVFTKELQAKICPR